MVSLPYPVLSGEKPVPDAEEKKAVCTGAPVNCRLINKKASLLLRRSLF